MSVRDYIPFYVTRQDQAGECGIWRVRRSTALVIRWICLAQFAVWSGIGFVVAYRIVF